MAIELKKIENINEFYKICELSECVNYNIFYRKINEIDDRSLLYKIVAGSDKEKREVGIAVLYDKDTTNKNIKIDGALIDSKDFNCLKEAAIKLLKISFEDMDMEKVYVEFVSRDMAKFTLLNRVRFIREGYLRDHTIIDGKKYSVEVWSMLRHEYTRFFNDEKRVKKLLLI